MNIRLLQEGALQGWVLDSGSDPVTGAEVFAWPALHLPGHGPQRQVARQGQPGIRSVACRMRLRLPLLIGFLIAFAAPAAVAGPLLDAALDKAEKCAVAAAQGEQAAREHIEVGLWAAGGGFNGLLMVIAPGVPVLAHLDNARPPQQALVGVLPDQLECFNNGYRRVAKRRRAISAWLGFAGGAAILLVWLAAHAHES